jgi:hypothetical protein
VRSTFDVHTPVAFWKGIENTSDEQALQEDCLTVEKYFNREHLKIYATKTRLLLTSLSPTGVHSLSTPLLAGGTAVEQVDSLVYLGVLVDQRLTFTQHAHKAAARFRRMLAVVGNTLRRWHMRAEIARIYTSCIRPVLTYAIAATYARTDDGRRAMERANRAAARMVLNTYTSNYTDMLCKLHWPTIASLATKDRLRLAHAYASRIGGSGGRTIDDKSDPIWASIQHQNARRSARLSNGRELCIIGTPPRRTHAHNTALRTIVALWNALPASVVQQPTKLSFIKACVTGGIGCLPLLLLYVLVSMLTNTRLTWCRGSVIFRSDARMSFARLC